MPDAFCGSPLHRLADAVGLAASWQDVHGRTREVPDETLLALIDAMGFECSSAAQLECSLRRLREENSHLGGKMIVVDAGEPIVFTGDVQTRYHLEFESGQGGRDGQTQVVGKGTVSIAPVDEVGYHRLKVGRSEIVLAVAPPRCYRLPSGAYWGVAAQVYSLRRGHRADSNPVVAAAQGAGDYGALATLAAEAGRHGAAALAISPVHALYAADPMRYSPYAPSSRLFFNVAYVDVQALGENALVSALKTLPENERDHAIRQLHTQVRGSDLVDWPGVQTARLRIAKALFQQFDVHAPEIARRSFEAFRVAGGDALQSHCLYEALHGHYASSLGPAHGWQDWPTPMQEPDSAAAVAFARQSASELHFHAFLQWLANEGMRKAQEAALGAGMSVGLISDLAIGTDPRGSQAWSAPQDILTGATVGAAPDLYHPEGQEWGLTAFSPRALQEKGFQPFLTLLRRALLHAGGVRIDHVLGLARMWLVPKGAPASQGAFLHYPLEVMLRLVALESYRHQAIVMGENLGTVPSGFNELLSAKGLLGTSVLWFEREAQRPGRFIPPSRWSAESVATTTTHDLPTVAGWWTGTDLQWRHKLGMLDDQALKAAWTDRGNDKRLLVQAMTQSSALIPEEGAAPVQQVMEWVSKSPAPLCVFPLEDLLTLPDQPNMPGTDLVDGHPNWLRRLPLDVCSVFDDETVTKSIRAIRRGRGRS
ncbi:MAG TPA: 4-alpha-glucanotransferase [Pusillimonas sp.]|uniref:4-alpha-glucanotransferase n=1 Tax=Pusillimonas sp. TaxID=3040095 RepID=UPI002B4AFDC1|nr:4-alpha-glucanotransferase [Pusillimonas sp.]HLU19252.1 4-alpha-glucanotransferase [Pusillimonas sp.]